MKDAKGHGSNSRGGSMSVPERHQLNVARMTVKMPAAMAAIMGGMTPEQAHALIQQRGSPADKAMAAEYAKMPDSSAAATLAGGHPKSAAVDTHPAFSNVDFNSAPPRQFKFKESTDRQTEKMRNNWS